MEEGITRRAALRMAAAGLAAAMWPGCKGQATQRQRTPIMANSDWDISVCGLNCARCDERLGKQCAGCRGPADRQWSGDCKFRPCAASKGINYCFDCDQFPCEKLQAFAKDGYEHHALTVANMKRMREIGLERWITEQPKVMFCPGRRA